MNIDGPLINFDETMNEAQLDMILKYGKASNRLGRYELPKLIYLPYGLVRIEIPVLQKKNDHDEVIRRLLRHQYPDEPIDLNGVTGNEVLSFYLFVRKELERIQNLEAINLSGEPDAKMLIAGIKQLDEFGGLATVHTLAQNDPLRHAGIKAMPYFEIYQILKLNKVTRDIDKRYAELVDQENKVKNQNKRK
jgi:hypothetical protein